jgi:hypothetical protein
VIPPTALIPMSESKDLSATTVLPPTVTPVLSLCVFRDASKREILLGVRSPTATSSRHPAVLSTPTMRVPWQLMSALLETHKVGEAELTALRGFSHLETVTGTRISVNGSMGDPLAYAVEGLMSRKLGWGDELVRGALSSEARAVAIARAVVEGCELDEPEDTFMLTVEVVLEDEVGLSPTASFSRLDWVATDLIETALEKNDPYLLISGGAAWEVCLYGLCVRSAAFATQRVV